MKYYKQIENNYILTIRIGGSSEDGCEEISETEYNEILNIIPTKPLKTETTDFRLTTDMTWEEYEIPQPIIDDNITDAEALNIILGGAE